MRAFKLLEISGVDRPAQVGAVVSLLKRRDDGEPYWKRDFSDEQRTRLAGTGAALEDGSYPIETKADLSNAIQAYGRASNPGKVKAHIISRAKSLGATSSLPDGWVGKQGVTEMSKELKKALGLPETATDAELATAIEKNLAAQAAATAKAEAQDAEIAKLKERLGKADMSDKHSSFMNNDKATLPKGGKPAFLAMSPGERDDHMSKNPIRGNGGSGDDPDAEKRFNEAVAAGVRKALSTEEVITVGGLEIRKSSVGEDMFLMFKAQHSEIAKERDARELLEFSKRAETEIPALPGETLAKANALRAIAKLAEAEKKTIEAMLKSGNDARKGTFKAVGADGGEGADMPVSRLDAMAGAYAKEHKVTFEKAYSEVMQTEEGRALYNQDRRNGGARSAA